MTRFAADVSLLWVEGFPHLWHRRTGRHLPVSERLLRELERWDPELSVPPDLKAVATRLTELYMLSENPPPPLESMIPARNKLALLFPEGLWLADPRQPRTGGYAWRDFPLNSREIAFWRACNGSRSVARAADAAGFSLVAATALLERLTSPEVQAIQLREKAVNRRDPSLERMLCPDGLAGPRDPDQYGPSGETTLEAWHRRISDAEHHFDDGETTVAHALGVPHPSLGGQPYGERLYDLFGERGVWREGTVVEVGPGDGELGAAFLARAGRPLDYIRVDVSPDLLRRQRQKMPGTREVLASAIALPFADRSVDLLFSNEVIADLSAVPYDPEEPPRGAALEVDARLKRYRIAPLPGRNFYNLGAWRMVEEIARVLAPGGAAWLSEFGSPDEVPEETTQLDHPEVSIHFGHLEAVARALGLGVRLEPMAEFLGADLRALQLWRGSYEGLRAKLRSIGKDLEARAYTPEQLVLPWPVEGLCWVPLSEPGAGPLITRFWCITLQK